MEKVLFYRLPPFASGSLSPFLEEVRAFRFLLGIVRNVDNFSTTYVRHLHALANEICS